MNLILFADPRTERCLNFLWSVHLVTLTKGSCNPIQQEQNAEVASTKMRNVGRKRIAIDEDKVESSTM